MKFKNLTLALVVVFLIATAVSAEEKSAFNSINDKDIKDFKYRVVKENTNYYIDDGNRVGIEQKNTTLMFALSGSKDITTSYNTFLGKYETKQAYKNANVYYKIDGNSVKEEIVLYEYSGNTIEYDFVFGGGYYHNFGDDVWFYNNNRSPIGRFVEPYFVDSDGEKHFGKYSIEKNKITVIFDDDKISSAKYPITIDPTYDSFDNSSLAYGCNGGSPTGSLTDSDGKWLSGATCNTGSWSDLLKASGSFLIEAENSGATIPASNVYTKAKNTTMNKYVVIDTLLYISSIKKNATLLFYISNDSTSAGSGSDILISNLYKNSAGTLDGGGVFKDKCKVDNCRFDFTYYLNASNKSITIYNANGTIYNKTSLASLKGSKYYPKFRAEVVATVSGTNWAFFRLYDYTTYTTMSALDFVNQFPPTGYHINANTTYYFRLLDKIEGTANCTIKTGTTTRITLKNKPKGINNFTIIPSWFTTKTNISVNCTDNLHPTQTYMEKKEAYYGVSGNVIIKNARTKNKVLNHNITVEVRGDNYVYTTTTKTGNATIGYNINGSSDNVTIRAYSTPPYDDMEMSQIYDAISATASQNQFEIFLENISDLGTTVDAIIRVYDSATFSRLEGARVSIFKENPTSTGYLLLTTLTTNSQGEIRKQMELYNVFYYFIVDYDGNRVYTSSSPSTITASPINIPVLLDENYNDKYKTTVGASASLTYTETSNYSGYFAGTFSYNSTIEGCVYVYHINSTGKTLVQSECINATAHTFLLNEINVTSPQQYISYLQLDTKDGYGFVDVKQLSVVVGIKTSNKLGIESVLLIFAGIIISAFAFMSSPSAGLVVLGTLICLAFVMHITLITATALALMLSLIVFTLITINKK
jgi:hypothetical protein